MLLHEHRQVQLGDDPEEWIKAVLRKIPMREAAISSEIAVRSRKVNLSHNDPANRFLIATVEVQGLTLVTSDQRIREECSVEVL